MILTDYDAHQQYDTALDDIYGDVELCGQYHYSHSRALKELDPIAYDTGFNDWCDSEDIEISDD